MRVRLKHAFIVLAGILVCVAGIAVGSRVRNAHASKDDSASLSIPRAAVAMVQRRNVGTTFSVAGELDPYQDVEIHAKVAGYIKKIFVDIGDRVHEGQTLAILEVPELSAQVQGTQAAVRHSSEEITRAKNEVTRDEANHAALHAEARRLQQAAAARPGLVAQQEIDDAVAKDLASEAQVEAAKSALAAAQEQLDVAKATQSQYSAMWDYTHITAPFDGVVTWRYSDTGALVQAGTSAAAAQPVVKLAQVNVLRLRLPVPDSIAQYVHDGSKADIVIQGTREHLKGTVTRRTDSLDRTTRTEQVEIDLANKDYHLSPGMYADVTLQVQNKPDALTIPVQAVMNENNKSFVWMVDGQNRLEHREIQTGIQEPSRVEVVAGLNDGDKVIIGNLSSYHSGQVVSPKLSHMADAQVPGIGGEQ
ncbi:MAG TPA: efflux RND transporter periplasmic adaptor subunit [Terriglobales bacterium]|nr:efflux RND transporter periplasmic adaptor subunit [Terriglobales bacterium]